MTMITSRRQAEAAQAHALGELRRALARAADELPADIDRVFDRLAAKLDDDATEQQPVLKSLDARPYGASSSPVDRYPLARRLLSEPGAWPLWVRSNNGRGAGFYFHDPGDVTEFLRRQGDCERLCSQWLGADAVVEIRGLDAIRQRDAVP